MSLEYEPASEPLHISVPIVEGMKPALPTLWFAQDSRSVVVLIEGYAGWKQPE